MLKFIEIDDIHIDDVNNVQVYDIEVEDDNSYNVEDVIVHNSVCTTKLATGFTRGTVNCILDCVQVAKKPIIADGGIKHAGDIAKALVLGSHMVMAGSMFAGFEESAGNLVDIDGKKYKEYFGSSTQLSKGKNEHIEGKRILVDYKGDMEFHLKYLEESLKSSISYGGGKDLSCLTSCEYFILEQ